MLAGVLLFVAGTGIRMSVAPAAGVTGGEPAVASASLTPVPSARSAASVAPSFAMTPAPPSDLPPASMTAPPTPSPSLEMWFADDFNAAAAWPVGDLGLLRASVSDGVYRVVARAADLPVVVIAGAGDGSPGADVTLTAELVFAADADASSAAGLVLEDADGTRLLALLTASGRVTLAGDSMESFDIVASGSIPTVSGRIGLGLSLASGRATVTVDGAPIASAKATLNPAFVGLAFWAAGTRTRFDVDTYRVWRTPRDPA